MGIKTGSGGICELVHAAYLDIDKVVNCNWVVTRWQ
jgi:hypothetical protein